MAKPSRGTFCGSLFTSQNNRQNLAMFALSFRFGEGIIGAIGTILGGLISLLLFSRNMFQEFCPSINSAATSGPLT
jgi:hypothetical protein